MSSRARAILGAVALLAIAASDAVAQSSFSVDPLLIRLDAQDNNAVLTITNPTPRDISFEIKAFAWDQVAPKGTMQLTPTGDIVVFPPLVTVKAKATQRVRVGTTLAPGSVEKSYRLMIEELPSAAAAPVAANQVNVRTRIGIPVFIEPTNPKLSGAIESVTVNGRVLSIVVANTGTTHAMVDSIVVRGMSGPDQIVFEDSIQGWYVLAGRKRTWEYTVTPAQCRPVKFVEVEVYAHDKRLASRADLPAGACGP